jgi:hypothetical protein
MMKFLVASTAVCIALAAGNAAYATAGKAGWQGPSTLNVTTGIEHGFYSYSCASGFVARSGAFFPDPTLQSLGINLGVNAPRIDVNHTTGYQTWGFEYNIPGGAPAGDTIQFDVYCTKPPI